jgi:hypothetical protein
MAGAALDAELAAYNAIMNFATWGHLGELPCPERSSAIAPAVRSAREHIARLVRELDQLLIAAELDAIARDRASARALR